MCFLSGCLRNRASTWGVAIHYFDNILHACLCSVTLRKRINNRLLLITFCMLLLAASPCGKVLPAPYKPLLRSHPAVALSRIAGLKYASMTVQTREPLSKNHVLFVNDRTVPRGIEPLDGEWLVLDVLSCHRCVSREGECGIERLDGE